MQAKLAGHGAIELFDAQHLSRDRRWLDLASRMYGALRQQEFSLVYQPRVVLGGGQGSSFEVLVRWQASEGAISPGEFIPIAEKSGFILPLGDWIIEQALAQMRQWLDQGHDLKRVAVNVSIRQLVTPAFVPKVLSLLSHYGVPASCLELEVTETAAMESLEFVSSSLQQLAEAGITLAMDDFGTGYSSLAYLQKLPFRVIKIDMSFVRRLGTPEGDELMQGMLALIRNLKRDIVAEGIETQAQLNWLQLAGCDEGQGFYLSKPLSVVDASTWLEQRR